MRLTIACRLVECGQSTLAAAGMKLSTYADAEHVFLAMVLETMSEFRPRRFLTGTCGW
jgi:hypothetical protein